MANEQNDQAAANDRRDFHQGLHKAVAGWYDDLTKRGEAQYGPVELDLLMLVGKLHEYLHSVDENHLGYVLPQCEDWYLGIALEDGQKVVHGPW